MECQEPRVCQEEIVLNPDNNVQLEEKKFKSLWQYCLKLKICCIQLIKIIIHYVILCLLFHNTKIGPNLIAFLLEAPSDVFCVMCRFGKRMHQRYIHEIMIVLSSFQRCPVRQKKSVFVWLLWCNFGRLCCHLSTKRQSQLHVQGEVEHILDFSQILTDLTLLTSYRYSWYRGKNGRGKYQGGKWYKS